MIQSLFIAFSMYSKIPVPKVEWNEKNMRYALCFFPWVGIVIGIFVYFLGNLLLWAGIGKLCFSVVMTLLPLLLTGGIHMDGFLDTIDAIHSYGDQEKKQQILKDPNCGAFAVIFGAAYLLFNVAVWSECTREMLPFIAVTYSISRTFSAFSMAAFPLARNTGLAATFQNGARRNTVQVVMSCYFLLEIVSLALWNPSMMVAMMAAFFIAFLHHYHLCKKQFGGISGDLAGYFLQVAELFALTAVCIAGRVVLG